MNKSFIYVFGYESLADLKSHCDGMIAGKCDARFRIFLFIPEYSRRLPGACRQGSGVISQMAAYDLKDGRIGEMAEHQVQRGGC